MLPAAIENTPRREPNALHFCGRTHFLVFGAADFLVNSPFKGIARIKVTWDKNDTSSFSMQKLSPILLPSTRIKYNNEKPPFPAFVVTALVTHQYTQSTHQRILVKSCAAVLLSPSRAVPPNPLPNSPSYLHHSTQLN
jgi:hypothetical protein